MATIKESIFGAIPLGLKGALLGVHSAIHAKSKYGEIYRSEVAKLRSRSKLGPAELQQVQNDLLADFLVAVFEVNSHYRSKMDRLGLHPGEIRRAPVDALLKLDVLDKQFFKDNISNLSSEGVRTFAISNTSGTTGSPMEVPYDISGYQKGFAYWRRFYDDMGLGDSFRNARFSGRILLGKRSTPRKFWVYDWYERRLFMSTYHMTKENLPTYVKKLNQYKPELIDGYPSALTILAKHIESSGAALSFKPFAIAVTAETLLESDRELISRVFGCGVFNQYASSEGAPPITQCFAGSMHINVDTGFFEFHEVAGDTSVFQLVVTSFRNLKVPLIRYRIGDVVKIRSDAGPCVCGSSFPRVDRIEGRIDDILVSTERGSVGRLDPVYKGVSGIERSQIVQEGKDRFRIKIVPGVGFSDETKRQLERNLRDRLGGSVEIVMEITDLIPLSANGKFRAVINDFSKSQ